MIKCKINRVEFSGGPIQLVAEFGCISFALRNTLSEFLGAESAKEMLDSVYTFRDEDVTNA